MCYNEPISSLIEPSQRIGTTAHIVPPQIIINNVNDVSLIPNVMNQCLDNDKKSMNNSPLRGGNLFLQYIQYTRQDKMILRLGLLGIYIVEKGYNYNERVQ
jgi:hypothetical protein